MKKTILISFIIGITLMFGSWAIAISKPGLPAPTLTCPIVTDADFVYFDWSDVTGATKYCVEVEVCISEVAGDCSEGNWDVGTIVRLSFGTGDRTDGGLMGDSYLDVPFADFAYDDDNDPLTLPVSLYGYPARAKVKALNPPGGKKIPKVSQNNPFSGWCEFDIEAP